MRILVVYFSATGITAKVANKLANIIKAERYDICPAVPYTRADLDWTNKQSRSSVEMNDKTCRPKLLDYSAPIRAADVIFIGFPIWWYREPSIIDSFLEAYDFTGKVIIPFATSGGSDFDEGTQKRISELSHAKVLSGKRFTDKTSGEELKEWAEKIIREGK